MNIQLDMASAPVIFMVAMCVAFFSSMGGLSGAFLLLPFQISVLGFAGPSASATNFLFNVVAIPSGVYRYWHEGRMLWPLAWCMTLGTLPGILAGYYIRVIYLPEPGRFKIFVGCVLLLIALRMVSDILGTKHKKPSGGAGAIAIEKAGLMGASFSFDGHRYSFRTPGLFIASFLVGIIGGAYGIGGGAVLSPFCISVLGLPVYVVAGASLFSTFMASVVGVAFYSLVPINGVASPPDWWLGAVLGAGGSAGLYLGASLQRRVPQRLIKAMLIILLGGLALKYLLPALP